MNSAEIIIEDEKEEISRRKGNKSWADYCYRCDNVIEVISSNETSGERVVRQKEHCDTYVGCAERDAETYNYELKDDENWVSGYAWGNYCQFCPNVIEMIWQQDYGWDTVVRVKKPCKSYKRCSLRDEKE